MWIVVMANILRKAISASTPPFCWAGRFRAKRPAFSGSIQKAISSRRPGTRPLCKILAITTIHIAHGVTDELRHLEHGGRGVEIRRAFRLGALLEQAYDRLRAGQTTRAQHHQHAVARALKHR